MIGGKELKLYSSSEVIEFTVVNKSSIYSKDTFPINKIRFSRLMINQNERLTVKFIGSFAITGGFCDIYYGYSGL